MNLPYSWLQELLPDAPPLQETVDLLASIGLGVEQVFTRPAAPAGVVVARITEVAAIEGSDHLLRATVDDGEQTHTVVTGAPNTRVGLLTAFARPGTTLPGAGFTVEVRDMMGVPSEGVLCSPKELDLYDYAGGLIAFSEDTPLGRELCELWPEETVIELELTPNRADAFSVLGVARDLAAKLGVDYKHPAHGLDQGDTGTEDNLRVVIDDPEGCPRFTLRLIEEVSVAPSPIWLQRRLASLGLRPRNNIVDVTNYVTFELGQPSHAYDRADLVDNTIVVRRANEGETLVALNEAALEFSSADLLITTPSSEDTSGDGTVPIGVAGVIGGLHHSVKADTTAVALEVAHFEPVTIRKTAKRLGLSTDAHYRFERGVDPNLPPAASARAAHLIAELGGGRLHPGLTDVGRAKTPETIDFRPSRVAFLVDIDVPAEQQRRYLEALGCRVEVVGDDHWQVTAPTWRFDLGIEEDLVEEVARLHGYDHIPTTLPAMHFVPEGDDATHRKLRDLLVGLGFQETINYVFTSDDELAKTAAPEAQVKLLNPQSAERSVLRTALYPSLLGVARVNRSAERLALFEVGRVFVEEEQERLGLLMNGLWAGGGWLEAREVDFFVFKGIVERFAATLGAEVRLEPATHPMLHPGVNATLFWQDEAIGMIGQIHPEIAAAYELPPTFVAELDLPLAPGPIGFREIQRQPYAERDLAIVAPRDVPYARIADMITEAAGGYLVWLEPFDLYEGAQIAAGQRSVAVRLRFRHPERALRDAEVDADMQQIVTALAAAGYDIRD
ncbi:MAG: phenylalanine--tRNA ligase subunit beta [Trueperaceae bacterium]|nr:phenylalanine--tRNA ligase subunit beta [Trueperaceae bacterium]